jgi:nucleotide-binding universal stress UspA family protein
MKNILVPIDFSDATEKILDKAVEFAKAFDANLLIIHVVTPVTESIKNKVEYQTLPTLGELGSGYTSTVRYDVVREQIAHELKKEHSHLLKIKSDLTDKGVKVRALLVEGEIINTILKETDEINASLIIIGSHGHGPWHKALLGSVADGILKNTKIPLVIIPADKPKEK